MRVSWETSTGHPERAGHVNEDFVGAVTDAVVLLDGAGIPGAEHLCSHGVAWYTRRLGGSLLARLPDHGRGLADVLADAIGDVADLHRHTCAIDDTGSPQAAVAVVRLGEGRLDVAVLGDCLVLVAREGQDPVLVTDGREDAVREECLLALSGLVPGTVEHDRAMEGVTAAFRARRNTAGGFWVAKDQPAAAHESVRSTLSLDDVTGIGLFSNGASRLVHPYQLADWPAVGRLLSEAGPLEVIRRVREAEEGSTRRTAGWDAPDDATVAWLRPDGHLLGRGPAATRLAR